MKLRYYLRGLGIGIIVTAIIMSISLGQKNKMSDEEIKKRAAELGMIENTVLAPADEEQTPEENPQTEEETVTVSPTPVTEPTEVESAILTPAADQDEALSVTLTEAPVVTLTAQPTVTPTPDAIPTLTAAAAPTPTPTSKPTPSAIPTPSILPTPTAILTSSAKPTQSVLPTGSPVAEGRDTVTITINGGEGSGTVSWKVEQAGLVENAADFDSYLCANGFDRHLAAGSHVIPIGASYEEIAQILMRR